MVYDSIQRHLAVEKLVIRMKLGVLKKKSTIVLGLRDGTVE